MAWAVEGTGHYGLGLARHLAAAGAQSRRSTSTRHVGKRRAGQERPDRRRPRREEAAGPPPAPAQMRSDGAREALRLLMIDRDNAVQSCKTARTVLDLGHRHRARAVPRHKVCPSPSSRPPGPRLRDRPAGPALTY